MSAASTRRRSTSPGRRGARCRPGCRRRAAHGAARPPGSANRPPWHGPCLPAARRTGQGRPHSGRRWPPGPGCGQPAGDRPPERCARTAPPPDRQLLPAVRSWVLPASSGGAGRRRWAGRRGAGTTRRRRASSRRPHRAPMPHRGRRTDGPGRPHPGAATLRPRRRRRPPRRFRPPERSVPGAGSSRGTRRVRTAPGAARPARAVPSDAGSGTSNRRPSHRRRSTPPSPSTGTAPTAREL